MPVNYYKTKDIVVFPSSNSQDEGKLTIEENMREITTRISNKNFVISGYDVIKSGEGLLVGEGTANFQGYNISTIAKMPLDPPRSILDRILVMKLAKDGSDHVIGDVTDMGVTTFNGVYLDYCDDEYAAQHRSDILILAYLGLAESETGIIITEVIKDPLSNNRLDAEDVEANIYGDPSKCLDSALDNFLFYRRNEETGELESYNPVQTPGVLKIDYTTKPPSYVTNMQEYLDNMIKSYVSKYGDSIYGGLSFKIGLDTNQGIIISPRRATRLSLDDSDRRSYYDIPIESSDDPESADRYYGGTLRSIVPFSYTDPCSLSRGRIRDHAIYSELVSGMNDLTGMRVRSISNDDFDIVSYSEIGNPSGKETEFKIYNEIEGNSTYQSFVRMDKGKIWIDSKRTGYTGDDIDLDKNPEYDDDSLPREQDGAIVIHTATTDSLTNIKSVFRNNSVSIEEGEGDRIYHEIGVRRYSGTVDPTNPNDTDDSYNYPFLELSSNNSPSFILKSMFGQNFIDALDPNSPYISIRPYVFTERVTSTQEIQLGTDRSVDGHDLDNHFVGLDNNIILTTDWTSDLLGNGISKTSSLVHRVGDKRQDQISQYYGMFSSRYVGVSDGATDSYNDARTLRYDSRTNNDYDNPYKDTDNYVRIENNRVTLNNRDNTKNTSTWIRFTTLGHESDLHAIPPTSGNYQANSEISTDGVSIEHKGGDNVLYLHGNLSVVGDINSPSLGTKYLTASAASMGSAKFGRVWNAVYNDIAENFEKVDYRENIEPGDVICAIGDNKYAKCCVENDPRVVGVCSDSYGYLLGGEDLEDMDKNKEKYIPIGLAGRVKVKVVGNVSPGDLLTSSSTPGHAKVLSGKDRGTVIGKAVDYSKDGYVYMIIMMR